MPTYRFTFKLSKHREARPFTYTAPLQKGEDVQGAKERIAMEFEKKYGTPVRCTKVEEINNAE